MNRHYKLKKRKTAVLLIVFHPLLYLYEKTMITHSWAEEKVHPILHTVASFLVSQQDKVVEQQIEEKDHNSLVSYVDKKAEEMLVEGLQRLIPEAGFLTEEKTVTQVKNTVRWIIDPLDGTTNYLFRLPCYAISVALEIEDELVAGWIYDVPMQHLYHAIGGEGAFKSGQRIRVRSESSLAKSLIATGFPYQEFTQQKEYMELLAGLMRDTRGIRRLGSAAIDMAYTAEGRFNAFYEYGLHDWDVAAGIVLVQEAGGHVCSFNGDGEVLVKQELIAGSDDICKQLVDRTRRLFYSL